MKNILIFGTGVNMQKMINYINYDYVNILAFVDNDKVKIGKEIKDKQIISPDAINNYDYDYIVIASFAYAEITQQLLQMNVSKDKIIQLYNGGYIFGETCFFDDEVVSNEEVSKLFTGFINARW